MKTTRHLKTQLNVKVLNCTMNGTEYKQVAHNFKYYDELHLEKKQIKTISTSTNYFSSTGITQRSCSSTFPQTNQCISNISREHCGECNLEDRRARREKGLGMEEGGASAGVTIMVRAESGNNE